MMMKTPPLDRLRSLLYLSCALGTIGWSMASASAQAPFEWSASSGGNGHWYERHDSVGDWETARVYAEDHGGHLVCITSAAENQLLADNGAGAWDYLGGFAPRGEGGDPDVWQWVTGELWAYAAWEVAEPNSDTETLLNFHDTPPAWNNSTGVLSKNFWIEWEADCNGDGIVDLGQILDGTFADNDDNGVPDHCEQNPAEGFIGFDGVVSFNDDFTVIQMFAVYDSPDVAALNVYNRSIRTSDALGFHHDDMLNEQGGHWLPLFSIDSPEADSSLDSYVTIGFGVGDDASENSTQFDPDFGEGSGPFIPSPAGWFNGNPKLVQYAEPFDGGVDGITGYGVQVGQFVFETERLASHPVGFFTFSGEMGSYTGPGSEIFHAIDTFSYSLFEDCNDNGLADLGELLNGTAADCDGNGIIDTCDIADGTHQDTDGDSIPDICEDPCDVSNGTLLVPENFATISAAIACAQEGDVIRVAPGTYNQRIDFQGKGITIESTDGSEWTVLDGSGLGDGSLVKCVNKEGPSSVLRGFTITNGQGGSEALHNSGQTYLIGSGIYVHSASPTIESCVFTHCSSGGGGAGFFFANGADCAIRSCSFMNNTSERNGGALHMQRFEGVIENCLFYENNSGFLGGALHFWSGSPTVRDCTMIRNSADIAGGAVSLSWGNNETGNAIVDNCVMFQNATSLSPGGGIHLRTETGITPDWAIISNTTICNNVPDSVNSDPGAPWVDSGGNEFCGCLGDMTFDTTVNGADLTRLLGQWGACEDPEVCHADLNFDNIVDGADLTKLLGAWGICP